MAVDFYNIFSPCAVLCLTSPTMATTSSKKIHKWLIYHLYIMLIYIAVVGTLLAQIYIYTIVNDMSWTVVNKPTMLTMQSLFYTILLAQSLMGVKKNKMGKLMDEINEIDDVDYSINDRKYKMYNAFFATILLVNHVGCTIVNMIDAKGAIFFPVPITIISIMSDVELLIWTSFVSILNAKMAHLALKLENIVKTREASNEELYERYRQGVRIVKRINNFWQGRMFVIIIFQLYFTTKAVMQLFAGKQSLADVTSVLSFVSKYAMSFRNILVFAHLGLIGQWLAETFDQIRQLANTIGDMDLGDELNHQSLKICRLAAVWPGRLHAGSLVVDGQLPLRAVSAVISTVILMLQFGVAV